jgi:hypothetical protein
VVLASWGLTAAKAGEMASGAGCCKKEHLQKPEKQALPNADQTLIRFRFGRVSDGLL